MIGWIFFAKSKIISPHLDSFQRFASAACFYLTSDWFTVVSRRSLSLTSFPAWLFFLKFLCLRETSGIRMAVCVSIGSKTRGQGTGESARGMLGRENNLYLLWVYLFMKEILLFGGDNHSFRLVSVFWQLEKKKASAARMQVDYISYSLISFNFLLVVIRT